MACTGIDDQAHSRAEVASPRGAKPVGDLPTHGAHADGLRAGGMRGGHGGIVQNAEEVGVLARLVRCGFECPRRVFRRCTSAHSAAMRASCSGSDTPSSSGRMSIAA
jgi:hypothetical protein